MDWRGMERGEVKRSGQEKFLQAMLAYAATREMYASRGSLDCSGYPAVRSLSSTDEKVSTILLAVLLGNLQESSKQPGRWPPIFDIYWVVGSKHAPARSEYRDYLVHCADDNLALVPVRVRVAQHAQLDVCIRQRRQRLHARPILVLLLRQVRHGRRAQEVYDHGGVRVLLQQRNRLLVLRRVELHVEAEAHRFQVLEALPPLGVVQQVA